MREHTVKLRAVTQTTRQMKRLARQYTRDVVPYKNWNLIEFYNYVKKIPYKRDPKGNEYLQRPKATLQKLSPYRDCDDKAICIAAYCIIKKIPWRYVAVSNKPDKKLHHVYNEIFIKGKWGPVDATYPENTLFKEKNFSRKVLI